MEMAELFALAIVDHHHWHADGPPSDSDSGGDDDGDHDASAGWGATAAAAGVASSSPVIRARRRRRRGLALRPRPRLGPQFRWTQLTGAWPAALRDGRMGSKRTRAAPRKASDPMPSSPISVDTFVDLANGGWLPPGEPR